MYRIEATFRGISLRSGREPAKIAPHFLLMAVSAAAILSLSGVGASLIAHKFTAKAVVAVPAAHHTVTSVEAPADFGAMIAEPEWVAKPAPPNTDYSSVASLEAPPSANIPLPSLDAFPLEPLANAVPRPAAAPLGTSQPQGGETPRLENRVPLPPPRPPGLGEPSPPTAPLVVQPAAPASAVDDRNLFQKLLGLGMPRTPGALATSGTQIASIAPESDAAVKVPSPLPPAPAATPPAPAATPTPGGSGKGSGWFGPGVPRAPQGYDQLTAVYDILARTVYLPDGTRIEAHSGLGDRLDDPRHVDEQARGATPPHLYELTLREGSFHGVQALRLTPIGEGDLYGRAGLLAHPYMLGPNGDSNGCVSVKDYDAFLRAYATGQIKRLMVVASANQVIATAEPQSRSSAR